MDELQTPHQTFVNPRWRRPVPARRAAIRRSVASVGSSPIQLPGRYTHRGRGIRAELLRSCHAGQA